jgi:hypothetical protein
MSPSVRQKTASILRTSQVIRPAHRMRLKIESYSQLQMQMFIWFMLMQQPLSLYSSKQIRNFYST